MVRTAVASSILLLLAPVVSAEQCCLCDNCEELQTASSICRDIVDSLVSLSDSDQQCVHLKANHREQCCAVAPPLEDESYHVRSKQREIERQLQYGTCRLCVDGRAPGKPCGGVTVGLQGGGQTALSCSGWYTEGLAGNVHPRTCNILGAAERVNNACGCDRSIAPGSCGGGWVATAPTGSPPAVDVGDINCFSGSTKVHVRGKGAIRMEELQVGDFVADSLDGTFSRVYSMAHVDPSLPATFLQITATGLDQPLEVSSSHLLFVSSKTVMASEVKIGDMLGLRHQVLDVQIVHRTGIFNPLTLSGTIVVNGVLASNYVGLLSEIPFDLQHVAAHMITSPVRVLCSGMYGHFCSAETHGETGISSWIQWPLRVAVHINSLTSGLAQVVVASLLFAVVFPLLVLSLCIEHCSSLPGQCIVALLASFAYFIYKRKGDLKKLQ